MNTDSQRLNHLNQRMGNAHYEYWQVNFGNHKDVRDAIDADIARWSHVKDGEFLHEVLQEDGSWKAEIL